MKILWQFVVLLYIRVTTHSYVYKKLKKKKKKEATEQCEVKKPKIL